MKIDLYRRPETGNQYSYLVVPQGRPIPQEATNTEWETVQRDLPLERSDSEETGLDVDDAMEQINEKGYAISSISKLSGFDRPSGLQ